jgi:hypothetical protein
MTGVDLPLTRAREQGSALVYILIAIALLAALTFTFMEPSSQQATSQSAFKSLSAIEAQVNTIRSAIQECVLSYPKGDKTIVVTGVGSDPYARKNYPINPNSTHYTAATPGRSGDRLVKNLRCPGNNPGGVNVKDHAMLFTDKSGKFLPPAPELFNDWEYYNGVDGVYFYTYTNKTDAFLKSALLKLDEKFSECEADVIESGSSAKDIDSDGVQTCAANNLCFRVWLIKNDSAEFNGDTDGDETAAGC